MPGGERPPEVLMRRAISALARSTLAAGTALLALALVLVSAAPPALAQSDAPVTGSTVRVANTDGSNLNLRAGPSSTEPIAAKLPEGETLTVTGPSQVSGTTRWVPVRTNGGQPGWVSSQYIVLVSGPVEPTATARVTGGSSKPDEVRGLPVEVEAKLKFPETDGRDQEITVTVTRNGKPVVGATVSLESRDGDGEFYRELDPTDERGQSRRRFDVRHEKGTVELQVEAIAPDGGEGRAQVSYFRR